MARGWRIAVAESCTGGLVTSRLTDIPGSSAWVERAVVAYSNEAKVALLGVAEADLAAHGAVSEVVAIAMAEGVRRLAGVEVGVGITGIAGPGGGSAAKPVGHRLPRGGASGRPGGREDEPLPGRADLREDVRQPRRDRSGAPHAGRLRRGDDAAPGTWEQAGRQPAR